MNAETIENIADQMLFIKKSKSLREVNKLLTQSMAQQKIQVLIKDEHLSEICNSVIDLALKVEESDCSNKLLAAAMLGRLSAVARGRESTVFSRLSELFDQYPAPIDSLDDGDEKYYAALTLSEIKSSWIFKYCVDQAVLTDTAEKARKMLLLTAVKDAGSLSEFWQKSYSSFIDLRNIEADDTRYKRIRRISSAVADITKAWEGEVGPDAGLALSDWLYSLINSNKKGAETSVLADILDDTLSMLLRIIELRFSNALFADTYAMLDKARSSLGREIWSEIIPVSNNIEKVRTCLKETALVLARQRVTDKDVMDKLCSAYYSRAQVIPAITSHFSSASELDPDVKSWWEKGGSVKEHLRQAEHKMGNSEDQQIGSLLINVEESKHIMEKLERAVVPFLEISDPPLAETVKKAAGSYSEIALAAQQLAGMRKLKRMNLKGAELPYNPLQHEMLGGHRLGVRTIRVERDGIQKDFGGKIKVLVKPRVVPEE